MTLNEFNKPKMAVWRKSGSNIEKVSEPLEKLMPFKYNRLILVKGKNHDEEVTKPNG